MALPIQPVTLSVDQIRDLNEKVSELRHDVNNYLSLLMTAQDLVRTRPEISERMFVTMTEQPKKISDAIRKFSDEFEKAMGIVRQQ